LNLSNFRSLAITSIIIVSAHAKVTITDSILTWHTNTYSIGADYGLISAQSNTSVEKKIKCKVIENEYLRVVIENEIGARIVSMIYKPTNHEELYTSPSGVPYGIKEGSFYYDWLMVYSGIMPTFSEPEHGKFWLRPWTYRLLKQNDDTISIAMSQKDTINFSNKPAKFVYGATGIECTFTVTIISGKNYVSTEVLLNNPGNQSKNYEYWTMTTLAPGSTKENPRTTSGAEIISNVKKVNIPQYWTAIRSQEQNLGNDIFTFTKLRMWKNWADMGIAYAWPDASSPINTFWGVINHDNEEGIIRVSDNDQTIGLKIWSWNYNQSVNSNSGTNLPYLELWAGVSKMFFSPANLGAGEKKNWKEYYIPTVKCTNVTHANEHVVCNFTLNKTAYNGSTDKNVDISAQLFFTSPGRKVTCSIWFDGTRQVTVCDTALTADPLGNLISCSIPVSRLCRELTMIKLKVVDTENKELISADLPVSITNTQDCIPVGVAGQTRLSHSVREQMLQVYSINGRFIGRFKSGEIKKLHSGLYLIKNGLEISPLLTTLKK
jgi:hypothetical protein